ncbi:glucanotransferase domain of glycogen debranching enzyme-domain-containing protein [Lentinula edodes]|uniref:glucanotransferase domain of glycogen debranching enzyme-domain-containing protein n=1 Tax=Lentinula edodes TaxID=5353 RepID=UPI001E8E98CE|nr:glucanotransferase domain of glycogen debranching enzyme-domain-containing protein [Lentinula edodes]KAH7872429.1 glucanotransferase domain of glycogen debranching enzyme-domain-containing protein [Lentinula edodes]
MTVPKLPSDFPKPIQINLPISHAGAFVFGLNMASCPASVLLKGVKAISTLTLSGLFPLPPSSGAILQKDTVNLPLDGLSILTVVSKWIGPMPEWKNHLAEAKDRGYTMLHYTPLQERGESDSAYSIRDQLKYDPSTFDGKRRADGGKEKVDAILRVAQEDYGLLSLTDIVLNHTANDSPWLVDHPESGSTLFSLRFPPALLGINSLIRESYTGWDAKEYSRLLYRHGVGKPVGSMDEACLTSTEKIPSPTGKGPLRKAVVTPLNASMPHGFLYDLTHDNYSPLHKRSAEDALSTGPLVTFNYSAIGSVKGFDDLYPKLLNLVGEKRKYEVTGLQEESGIARVKRLLNSLHLEMVLGGMGKDMSTKRTIINFDLSPSRFAKNTKDRGYVSPIKLIDITSYDVPVDAKTLKGLPRKLVEMSPVVVPHGLTMKSHHGASLEEFVVSNSQEVFANLGLVELNVVLYRANGEERDATNGQFGVYDVPSLSRRSLYCGLEGWIHPLVRHIMRNNDLGHPLQADDLPNRKNVAQWFKDRFDRIKATALLFLRPQYFALVISEAYKLLVALSSNNALHQTDCFACFRSVCVK